MVAMVMTMGPACAALKGTDTTRATPGPSSPSSAKWSGAVSKAARAPSRKGGKARARGARRGAPSPQTSDHPSAVLGNPPRAATGARNALAVAPAASSGGAPAFQIQDKMQHKVIPSQAAPDTAHTPAIGTSDTRTATDEWLGGNVEQWAPWVGGGILAGLCLYILMKRWRRHRERRRLEARALALRGHIGWSHVRTPQLPAMRPEALVDARRLLPQLSVDVLPTSGEPPTWLDANLTMLHDTRRAAELACNAVHNEAASPLDWTLAPSPLSSLTYRLKGMPAIRPVAPAAEEAAPSTGLAGHMAAHAAVVDDAHPAEAAARELARAAHAALGVQAAQAVAPMPVDAAVAHPAVARVDAVSAPVGPGDATVEVEAADAPAAMPATPIETAPDAPVVSASERIAMAVNEGKRRLTNGRPQDAIAALLPVLHEPAATGEAWSVAGWSWWRLANDHGQALEGATQAARAFEQALKVEPGRVDLLSRMIGRCHVLRAQHQSGQDRVESLDDAVVALRRARAQTSHGRAVETELAGALYERAMVTAHAERASWLDRVQSLLDALQPHNDTQLVWLQANTLWARADVVDARAAQTLHARASALVVARLPHLDGEQGDAWLTRWVDGERAHLQRLNGAARITRLQQIQASIQPHLANVGSIAPLLSWIAVLGDWSGNLQGTAAIAKLDEADALFERIRQLAPKDSGGLHFAHAYYLRLRSGRERSRTAQDAALLQAERLLARIGSDELPLALVQLELAEIHLARARLSTGSASQGHFTQAASLGIAAARSPENEARALTCALIALVALQSTNAADESRIAALRTLSRRLIELTPSSADALRLSAQVHLLSGEHGQASEFCNAAWTAGAHRNDVMPVWQQADALWARELGTPDHHPHWKRLHQRMRLANSTS